MPGISGPQLRESLARDGFVKIPSVLSPEELSKLRAACARSTALAREGKWPYIRTLPKQFPPWTTDVSSGIWGVQHLMHPDLPDHDLFAESYFTDKVVGPVKELLQCGDDELIMELYNLLVRPDHDFELRWHRDDIPATVSDEEELERLNEPAFHAQWNLALYNDRSLIVVPGSHKRARTTKEREADPFEPAMPEQIIVEMQPGDVVFYNNNILHRGVYDPKVERMTLHGSIGQTKGSKHRSRNVLQHGVGSWVDSCDFKPLGDPLQTRANTMRERLIEMGRASGDVGYAHED